ncbi:hypothetical protein SAMN05421823_11288 [Catalinimonas alkaloidigena]|uniref:Outer membrane protein beta-barrel domain-containing protein n=1 Tax=Catalinimonas alkaloidigena TaxID=1075417 RepID=A0A1G9SAN3_9BACT|nr:hypothetical protein [Catalinimonas alkaloidigena]SDM32387.1 hypothetical protein SAMN05421823_11288 [Catalinimonas alkaloidigena]
MRASVKFLIVGWFTLLWGRAVAQEIEQPARFLPLRISVFNETTHLPSFSRLGQHLNPGVLVGSEIRYRERKHHAWVQTWNIGYAAHRQLHTTLLVTSEFTYRLKVSHFVADIKAGPGYLLHRSYLPVYRAYGTGYEKASAYENRLALTSGLSLGYRWAGVTPFVGYNVMVEAPFLRNASLFLPHQLLLLGIVFPVL